MFINWKICEKLSISILEKNDAVVEIKSIRSKTFNAKNRKLLGSQWFFHGGQDAKFCGLNICVLDTSVRWHSRQNFGIDKSHDETLKGRTEIVPFVYSMKCLNPLRYHVS